MPRGPAPPTSPLTRSPLGPWLLVQLRNLLLRDAPGSWFCVWQLHLLLSAVGWLGGGLGLDGSFLWLLLAAAALGVGLGYCPRRPAVQSGSTRRPRIEGWVGMVQQGFLRKGLGWEGEGMAGGLGPAEVDLQGFVGSGCGVRGQHGATLGHMLGWPGLEQGAQEHGEWGESPGSRSKFAARAWKTASTAASGIFCRCMHA